MLSRCFVFFFFNDTATTEIYTLSLHDALPICAGLLTLFSVGFAFGQTAPRALLDQYCVTCHNEKRSEEHTSELQSQSNLVCRLLLEKKNKPAISIHTDISIASVRSISRSTCTK